MEDASVKPCDQYYLRCLNWEEVEKGEKPVLVIVRVSPNTDEKTEDNSSISLRSRKISKQKNPDEKLEDGSNIILRTRKVNKQNGHQKPRKRKQSEQVDEEVGIKTRAVCEKNGYKQIKCRQAQLISRIVKENNDRRIKLNRPVKKKSNVSQTNATPSTLPAHPCVSSTTENSANQKTSHCDTLSVSTPSSAISLSSQNSADVELHNRDPNGTPQNNVAFRTSVSPQSGTINVETANHISSKTEKSDPLSCKSAIENVRQKRRRKTIIKHLAAVGYKLRNCSAYLFRRANGNNRYSRNRLQKYKVVKTCAKSQHGSSPQKTSLENVRKTGEKKSVLKNMTLESENHQEPNLCAVSDSSVNGGNLTCIDSGENLHNSAKTGGEKSVLENKTLEGCEKSQETYFPAHLDSPTNNDNLGSTDGRVTAVEVTHLELQRQQKVQNIKNPNAHPNKIRKSNGRHKRKKKVIFHHKKRKYLKKNNISERNKESPAKNNCFSFATKKPVGLKQLIVKTASKVKRKWQSLSPMVLRRCTEKRSFPDKNEITPDNDCFTWALLEDCSSEETVDFFNSSPDAAQVSSKTVKNMKESYSQEVARDEAVHLEQTKEKSDRCDTRKKIATDMENNLHLVLPQKPVSSNKGIISPGKNADKIRVQNGQVAHKNERTFCNNIIQRPNRKKKRLRDSKGKYIKSKIVHEMTEKSNVTTTNCISKNSHVLPTKQNYRKTSKKNKAPTEKVEAVQSCKVVLPRHVQSACTRLWETCDERHHNQTQQDLSNERGPSENSLLYHMPNMDMLFSKCSPSISDDNSMPNAELDETQPYRRERGTCDGGRVLAEGFLPGNICKYRVIAGIPKGLRKVWCKFCRKSMPSDADLVKHCKEQHQFSCNICCSVFKTSIELRTHHALKHQTLPHKCISCDRVFTKMCYYQKHIKSYRHLENVHHEERVIKNLLSDIVNVSTCKSQLPTDFQLKMSKFSEYWLRNHSSAGLVVNHETSYLKTLKESIQALITSQSIESSKSNAKDLPITDDEDSLLAKCKNMRLVIEEFEAKENSKSSPGVFLIKPVMDEMKQAPSVAVVEPTIRSRCPSEVNEVTMDGKISENADSLPPSLEILCDNEDRNPFEVEVLDEATMDSKISHDANSSPLSLKILCDNEDRCPSELNEATMRSKTSQDADSSSPFLEIMCDDEDCEPALTLYTPTPTPEKMKTLLNNSVFLDDINKKSKGCSPLSDIGSGQVGVWVNAVSELSSQQAEQFASLNTPSDSTMNTPFQNQSIVVSPCVWNYKSVSSMQSSSSSLNNSRRNLDHPKYDKEFEEMWNNYNGTSSRVKF